MEDKERQERIEHLVSTMAESHAADLHKRVHSLERWQVGVDAFKQKQEAQMEELKLSIKGLERTSNRVTGALLLMSVVAPVLFMAIVRIMT